MYGNEVEPAHYICIGELLKSFPILIGTGDIQKDEEFAGRSIHQKVKICEMLSELRAWERQRSKLSE